MKSVMKSTVKSIMKSGGFYVKLGRFLMKSGRFQEPNGLYRSKQINGLEKSHLLDNSQ